MVIQHKKGVAYYLALPMVDADSPAEFCSGETVADTAYYKDGAGAWASLAITDTFSEIGATGIYEIDLSSSEMNHDLVLIKLTSTNAADSFVMFEMFDHDIDDAALASVCTSARLGELDAANIPADIDTLKTRCSEARLAELDAANLPTDIAAIPTNPALASVCTETRLAELDPANLPADIDTLKTRCSEARLSELDAANLPTDIAAIPTNPALASVCTEARLAELDAANLPTDIAAIPTNPALASVCTEARLAELDTANLPTTTDGIKTKTDALPASWNMTDIASVPAINASVVLAINWLYVLARNKMITNKTNSEIEVYKDNSSTKFAESDISDNGTLFTRGKFGAVD